MAKETNEILGHSEDADGIEEYDNPLPDWWLGLFFFSIVWAVGYTVEYHFVDQRSQVSMYEAQMAAAAVRWPVPEAPTAVSMDHESVEAGAALFAQTCASCHGPDLKGGIGPDLTDAVWIHGGEPAQVLATITNGVSAKGMPAWGPILGPAKVQQVAAFVLSQGGGGGADAPAGVPDAPPAADADDAGGVADADVDGEAIYVQNCAACHGPDLGGLVGPNLVDGEWIHGGELPQIVQTITVGVPEKGMIQWGPILGEEKIEAVARFVHSKGAQPL